jgi:Flp pilus assembly protein TadG
VSQLRAEVRHGAGPPPARPSCRRRFRDATGSLSLESVLLLPVLALLILGLLEVAALTRDVLVAHEAARAGARAAATTSGVEPVVRAARAAAPELDLDVVVAPATRRDGDLARVTVTVRRRAAGTGVPVRASAVSRVEPAVGRVLPGAGAP